jgi:RNA recognition motif-containing protein
LETYNKLQPASDRAGTLWIGDLPYFADEAFLHRLFVGTGNLVSVKIMRNKSTQISLGYGFLEFSSHDAANTVLATFNGKSMPGTNNVFRLNWAAFGVGKPVDGVDFSCFIGDLAPDVTDYVLQEHFRAQYPSVRSAKVITDPMTGRSKGFGFCRFGDEGERDRAIVEMAGHFINNRPIRVSTATARKAPSVPFPPNPADRIPHPSDFDPTNTTIFIGGLSPGINEEDLRNVFGRFGEIIYTKVPANKGCGFCQFVDRSAAETAMQQLQGQVLGDSAIRLSWGRSAVAARPASGQMRSFNPIGYAPGSAFGALQPAAAAAYAAPFGYGLGQPAGMPSSIYPGIPQAYGQHMGLATGGLGQDAFGYGASGLNQGNMMDALQAQFAGLSTGGPRRESLGGGGGARHSSNNGGGGQSGGES